MTEKQTEIYEAIMERYNIIVDPNRQNITKDSSIISKVHSYLNRHKRIKAFCKYGDDGVITSFKTPQKQIKKV